MHAEASSQACWTCNTCELLLDETHERTPARMQELEKLREEIAAMSKERLLRVEAEAREKKNEDLYLTEVLGSGSWVLGLLGIGC